MPTYEYRCNSCGHEFELFQGMSDPVKRTCPSCKKKALERLIGTGSAVLFKGSGFYETDYRSASYKKGAEAEKKSSEPKGDDGKKSESKKQESGKTDTKKGPASDKPSKPTTPAAKAE